MKGETITFDTPWGDFEWNSEKESVNILKHKIDFQTACEVFADDYYLFQDDEAHSFYEQRSSIIGSTLKGIDLLLVVYTERGRTRIISARKANKSERKKYVREKNQVRPKQERRNP